MKIFSKKLTPQQFNIISNILSQIKSLQQQLEIISIFLDVPIEYFQNVELNPENLEIIFYVQNQDESTNINNEKEI